MIQPDFCHATQKCDGCDEETDTGVWFDAKNGYDRVVLCFFCCAALLSKAHKHPKRVSTGGLV